jgi:putative addiction module CopG family antidote
LTGAVVTFRLRGMEVRLSPEQEVFVRQAIESGRFHGAEDVVREALEMWHERERKRADIMEVFEFAEASVTRVAKRNVTKEPSTKPARKGKGRGRKRVAADKLG